MLCQALGFAAGFAAAVSAAVDAAALLWWFLFDLPEFA
jgi:hypothetical protein